MKKVESRHILNTIVQYPQIAEWTQSLVGTGFKLPRLAQSTSRKLRSLGHPVFATCHYDEGMTPGDITFAASYYDEEDDEVGRRFIEIVLISHPSSKDRITLTAETLKYFAVCLVECLAHEYQHQYQYKERKFLHEQAYASKHPDADLAKKQGYLGMKMEVDAFAVNIAARLLLLYGDDAGRILAQGSKLEWEASPDLYSYYQVFGEQDPVIKSLLRKINNNIRDIRKLT